MPETASDRNFRITEISAKNFRSIKSLQMSLGSITVLVGPNAAGKSNVLDVLRFIEEALRLDLEAAIASRRGLGTIRRGPGGGRPYNVEVGIKTKVRSRAVDYSFVLASGPGGQYKIAHEEALFHPTRKAIPPERLEVRVGVLVQPNFLAPSQPAQRPSYERNVSPEATDLILPSFRRLLLMREGRLGSASLRRSAEDLSHTVYQLIRYLTRMRFYQLFPNAMREPQKPGNSYPLTESGDNLGSVLREMERSHSRLLGRLKEALRQVIPGVTDLHVAAVGGYLVVKLKHMPSDRHLEGAWFDLSQESDGTLRLLGILVALYQDPPLPLIGIEEPELTIHPGALAVLADHLSEATRRSQVLLTTHSPDLIDRLPVSSLRVVTADAGITAVGLVSRIQLAAVKRGLFSPGELHRTEGLVPDPEVQ